MKRILVSLATLILLTFLVLYTIQIFKSPSYPVSQKLSFKNLTVVLGMEKDIEELSYDSAEDIFSIYQPGGYSTFGLISTNALSALASVDTNGDGALFIKKCDKKPYSQLGEHVGAVAITCEITHINPEDTTQSDSSSITNCYIPLKDDMWLAYEQKMKFQGDVDLCDSLKKIGLKNVSVELGGVAKENEKQNNIQNHLQNSSTTYYVDLDNDGQIDMLSYPISSDTCGTGGCTLMVYKWKDNDFVLVSRTTSVQSVYLANTYTNGVRDIVTEYYGGGGPRGFVKLQFDGKNYPPSSLPESGPSVASTTGLEKIFDANGKVLGTAPVSISTTNADNLATSTYVNNRLGFSISLPKIIKSRTGKYLSVEARDDEMSNFVTVGPTSYGDYIKIYVAHVKNRAELENFIYSYMPEDKDCKIASFDQSKVGIQGIKLEYRGKDEGGGIYCGSGAPVYIKYDAHLGKVAAWVHPGQDTIFLGDSEKEYDFDIYNSFTFISK